MMNGNQISVDEGCRLGMIADDLTGACDAGVQFAARGFSTLVRLNPEPLDDVPTELTVITTNTRSVPPDEAYQKVQQVCYRLAQNQITVLYKKIDSTLNGNIGVEVDAVMEGCGFSLAIITPAFPAQGRTLIDGRLHVSGGSPADALHLPTLLNEQSGHRVAHLDRTVLQGGQTALLDALRRTNAAGAELVVVDAASAEDLTHIACATMELTPTPLMVGSAGLAAQAATILAAERQVDDNDQTSCSDEGIPGDEREQDGEYGSIAIFVGSCNPVTAAQIRKLIATRAAHEIQLDKDVATKARGALRAKRHLVVPVHWTDDEASYLSQRLLPLFEEPSMCGLVLTGGDTAGLVLNAIGATGIRLVDQIGIGIPWGQSVGGQTDGLAVCTKAGGFGDEDTLVTVVDFLAQRIPKLR